MHYEELLQHAATRQVQIAVIGAGDYGRSLIFQAQRVPGLSLVAVCDRELENTVAALQTAGFAADQIAICGSPSAAQSALEHGKVIVCDDALLLMPLPFDVVVESTGVPEAAAVHAEAAIANGKHLVMVSKEADSVIGPLLHARAAAAGLVYTPVDGDQPSLLIQLVLWARLIGLEVLCAGKASEYDFVYDSQQNLVTCLTHQASVPAFKRLWDSGDDIAATAAARSKALSSIPQHTVADLTEMGIVANALGLAVDVPAFHAPIARTSEIADLLVPTDRGGILGQSGVVDVVNLLRRPDEFSLAGGVFITVACEDTRSWEMLRGKGHLVSRNGQAATIAHPIHLLGIQSASTLLLAALQGRSSGTREVQQHFDVVGRAQTALAAGTCLQPHSAHHIIDGVQGELQPPAVRAPAAAVPFHMLSGHRLAVDVSPGELITYDKIVPPQQPSRLWTLRQELEERFLIAEC